MELRSQAGKEIRMFMEAQERAAQQGKSWKVQFWDGANIKSVVISEATDGEDAIKKARVSFPKDKGWSLDGVYEV